MSLNDLKAELDEEVSIILASEFSVEVTETKTVPHSNDGRITFPNLDAKTQSTKLIDTCVLYIDIRRSTELNLSYRAKTVAKLYSAFVRAMTRAARFRNGHVRGIIGDRVMVLFDQENAFVNAVDCAVLMNSVGKYIINKHFTREEVAFGIGIDAGKMLVTKTGIRKRGNDQGNYKNLVWLGRPANVASKLTDIASKPGEKLNVVWVRVAYSATPQDSETWQWGDEPPHTFVKRLQDQYGVLRLIKHESSVYAAHYTFDREETIRDDTPPILMTQAVWDGYRKENPDRAGLRNGWWQEVAVSVPGYTGKIYGGDIWNKAFC